MQKEIKKMTFHNFLKWGGLTVLFALVGGIFSVRAGERPATVYKVGDTVDLKKIAVKDLNGKAVDWGKYKDKTLVLSYFASW